MQNLNIVLYKFLIIYKLIDIFIVYIARLENNKKFLGLLTWVIQKIVLFVLLAVVIIIFAAIITLNPEASGWEFHPCCRPVRRRRISLWLKLGSGSGFFKLDSELTKQDIMLEGKFMN